MPLSERTTILHHTLRSSLASIVVNDYPSPKIHVQNVFKFTVFKLCL